MGLFPSRAGRPLNRAQLVIAGMGYVQPDSGRDALAVEPMFRRGAAGFVDADADRAVGDLLVRDSLNDDPATPPRLAKRGEKERQRGKTKSRYRVGDSHKTTVPVYYITSSRK